LLGPKTLCFEKNNFKKVKKERRQRFCYIIQGNFGIPRHGPRLYGLKQIGICCLHALHQPSKKVKLISVVKIHLNKNLKHPRENKHCSRRKS